MRYAPGSTLCLVECEDIRDEHDDKFVCTRRKIIKRVDMAEQLRCFARECALSVIHLWDAPDVVVQYLRTGDEKYRAAARAAAAAAAATAVAARAAAAAAAATAVADWGAAAAAAATATAAADWGAVRATATIERQKAAFQRIVDGVLGAS